MTTQKLNDLDLVTSPLSTALAKTFVLTSEMRMCASFWLQILSGNLPIEVDGLTAEAEEAFEALREGPDCTRQKGKVSSLNQIPTLPRHH